MNSNSRATMNLYLHAFLAVYFIGFSWICGLFEIKGHCVWYSCKKGEVDNARELARTDFN
jgi:hypothetical protein